MGIKSTETITRDETMKILREDIEQVGNDVLGDLLDTLADSDQSNHVNRFQNFLVCDELPKNYR